METIYVKTIDPISQDLLRSAAQQGLKLNWERYESLQPQDGFLRVGLSCPYGCLQGPCRIDPFGRGPDRGLCGLERDGMVAAFLLRLSLHGALEAMNGLSGPDKGCEVSWPEPLNTMVDRALKNLGGNTLSLEEVYNSAFLLQRPMEPPERLILQALRLGVMTLGLLEQGHALGDALGNPQCKAGYGLLAGDDIVIGISGHPSRRFLKDVQEEASRKSSISVRLVSLGDLIPLNESLVPCACTSGEAELVVSSGRIALLLAGPGADPSLPELCRRLDVPLVKSQDVKKAEELLSLARESSSSRPRGTFNPDPALVQEARINRAAGGLEDLLKKNPAKKLALLGGADTPQQSFGWIPVEVASALLGEGVLVAGWGDAALWMLKGGLAAEEREYPARLLDDQQGPLIALKAMAVQGKLQNLQGICFTGLKACRDLAVALGLASLGCKVCIAVPLPLWGSENVRTLLADRIAAGGGILAHFDHPPNAQELLEWFLKR
ncbi:MAG: hypothetical protein JRG73_06290 [Deltaproteobacteria bacterium]|nr:hypothetical protein [Deltaproteobacteria bacterium]